MTIAEELAPREHVVRITLGSTTGGARETAFVLDGFEIGEDEPTDPLSVAMPYLPYAAGALLVGGAAIFLLGRRRRAAAA